MRFPHLAAFEAATAANRLLVDEGTRQAVRLLTAVSKVARKRAEFGASKGGCNPVKVPLPELAIEGGIFRTQAGQLNLHICAVARRDERDLN